MSPGSRAAALCLAFALTQPLSAAKGQPGPIPLLPSPPPLTVSVDWSMPERFGLDVNGNGFIDVPNTIDYVSGRTPRRCPQTPANEPPTFCVELTARFTLGPSLRELIDGLPVTPIRTNYRWTVFKGREIDPIARSSSTTPRLVLPLAEGLYRAQVDLVLQIAGVTESASTTRNLMVDDILIVSMGDSYSSGEGNPEEGSIGPIGLPYPEYTNRGLDAVWADDGSPRFLATPEARDHHRAHRSTIAWPALAALELERRDPRTSVTFVHVAASGATIRKLPNLPKGIPDWIAAAEWASGSIGGTRRAGGLLEPYLGAESTFRQPEMASQVDQVAGLLGCDDEAGRALASRCDRQIDALTLSIGGNDIGFSQVVAGLVDADRVTDFATYHDAVDEAIRIGTDRIATLPSMYAEIAGRFRTELDIFRTYIMEYPDPTGDLDLLGGVVYCDEIVGDVQWPFEINVHEQHRAVEEVMRPLNEAMRQAALAAGWAFVGGVADEFGGSGHGYCAPSSRRWFRTATESLSSQGPDPGCTSLGAICKSRTLGTLHPNRPGHTFMARALLGAMTLQSPNPAAASWESRDQLSEAATISTSATSDSKDQCIHTGSYPCTQHSTKVTMFKVNVGRNQRMTFRVDPVIPRVRSQIRLFDAAGTDLTRDAVCAEVTTTCSTRVSTLTHTFEEPGTYYLGVSAAGNDAYDPVTGLGDRPGSPITGGYRFRAFNVTGQPDNTISTANELTTPQTLEGYSVESPLDVDMFALTATSAGTIRVGVESAWLISDGGRELPVARVVPGGNARFSVRLFDEGGAELAKGEGSLSHELPSPGRYFVGISPGDAAAYDPTVGVPEPPGQLAPGGLYRLSLAWPSPLPPGTETIPEEEASPDPEVTSAPGATPEPGETPVPEPTTTPSPGPPPTESVRNRPPRVTDHYVTLDGTGCDGRCSWYLWFGEHDVIDREGDAWAFHSWRYRGSNGKLKLVRCTYDPEHGCFRFSTKVKTSFTDSFTYRVWDELGSGRPSKKGTVTLCVHCR